MYGTIDTLVETARETSDYKDCTDPCGKCSDSQRL